MPIVFWIEGGAIFFGIIGKMDMVELHHEGFLRLFVMFLAAIFTWVSGERISKSYSGR